MYHSEEIQIKNIFVITCIYPCLQHTPHTHTHTHARTHTHTLTYHNNNNNNTVPGNLYYSVKYIIIIIINTYIHICVASYQLYI